MQDQCNSEGFGGSCLIVCGHSRVEPVEDGWKVKVDRRVGYALGLFPGQTLFGASEEKSKRLFLSPLRLNPEVSYFRIFLEDMRGSLAKITRLFSESNINILSGGAFGFGNIWVSEFISDFKGIQTTPEAIINEIEGLGGFVTSREITEFFPKAFHLESTYEIRADESNGLCLLLPEIPEKVGDGSELHVVLKAWSRVQALFIDFYAPENKLLKISVKIQDIPGSLNKLASLLGNQLDLQAIDEQHHDEASGVWTLYGILMIGSLAELYEKANKMSNILMFEAEPLGWEG